MQHQAENLMYQKVLKEKKIFKMKKKMLSNKHNCYKIHKLLMNSSA